VIGRVEPRTLGVGYDNITAALSGTIAGRALLVLIVLKLLSWAIYLGSGTSGGTLAPLFTIGGGAGALVGSITSRLVPSLGVDARIAALVGMAAIFAGASHALLASVVFAFETTRQPVGLLPLLAGCAAAYLVSLLFSRHSIMTEKLARRGTPVHLEYTADHLAQVLVRDAMTQEVVTLSAERSVRDVAEWLAAGDERDADGRAPTSHQGFPVLDADGSLVGVVSRRDLLRAAEDDGDQEVRDIITRPPVVVYGDSTLRQAGDHMVLEKVGRLPVVTRERPDVVIGIITVRDLLSAHGSRLAASRRLTPHGFARRG
jgi:CBS domain-containing protein